MAPVDAAFIDKLLKITLFFHECSPLQYSEFRVIQHKTDAPVEEEHLSFLVKW